MYLYNPIKKEIAKITFINNRIAVVILTEKFGCVLDSKKYNSDFIPDVLTDLNNQGFNYFY